MNNSTGTRTPPEKNLRRGGSSFPRSTWREGNDDLFPPLYFAKRGQTQNLKFELGLNVSKIDTWLEELEKYRHAVNGDALHNWPGYFDIGKAVSVTANAMFASGLLYKVLDKDDIAALQKLFAELSPAGEQYMNNQLGEYRRLFYEFALRGTQCGPWIFTANSGPAISIALRQSRMDIFDFISLFAVDPVLAPRVSGAARARRSRKCHRPVTSGYDCG